MTCVASTAFSFADKYWPLSGVPRAVGLLLALLGARVILVFRGLGAGFVESLLLSLSWNSSFKVAEMVGLHVDTDDTALRTASARAAVESMLNYSNRKRMNLYFISSLSERRDWGRDCR